MWQTNWRDNVWSRLDQPWDMIVVGGGITGAGILRLATSLGLHPRIPRAAAICTAGS